jgi:hypothetical protein
MYILFSFQVEQRKTKYWCKAVHHLRAAGGYDERTDLGLKKKWGDLKVAAKKYHTSKNQTGNYYKVTQLLLICLKKHQETKIIGCSNLY